MKWLIPDDNANPVDQEDSAVWIDSEIVNLMVSVFFSRLASLIHLEGLAHRSRSVFISPDLSAWDAAVSIVLCRLSSSCAIYAD